MSLLIKNTRFLDVIGEKIQEDMDLYIEGSRIAKIGKNLDIQADEVLDGRGKLVTPGFINGHTHLGMSLLRNYADDLELQTWLEDAIWPIEAKLDREDIYWGSLLSMAEMIRSGATCFCDQYYEMDRVGDAALEIGMRGILTRGLIEDGDKDLKLDQTRALYQKYHKKGNGRLRVVPSPHAIYTCGEDYLKEIIDLAKEMDGVINIHMSETIKEVEDCKRDHYMTPIQYIESLGMLDLHVIAAHCVHITEEEMDLVKNRRFYPIYNPSSNLKLASGFTPVQKMLDKGIVMGIGTDGDSSNNNQNILEEIHIGSIVNKAVNMDPKALPAMEILKMATINGAKALGLEDQVGSIEEGKAADLAIFNLNSASFTPKNNLISALCYSAQAEDVESVLIDGEFVLRDRQLTKIDYDDLLKTVQDRMDQLVRR